MNKQKVFKVFIDETGNRYGKWTVLRFDRKDKHNNVYFVCRCDCGVERSIAGGSLRYGSSKGCVVCRRKDVSDRAAAAPWRTKTRFKINGYEYVTVRRHKLAKKSGMVAVHRLVMEEKLGRSLFPNEGVHHLNGDRSDNRPENLELWVTPQRPGQRPADLVRWAKELLERYEPDALAPSWEEYGIGSCLSEETLEAMQ